MAQNIYDDEAFFAGYSQLPRAANGLDQAPEWPRLRSMVPDLDGARVADLGCGFGWFCSWAADQGAASVLGIDVSERMLDRANSEHAGPTITYRRADLESLTLDAETFDLIYSCLALHYLEDLTPLLEQVASALAPGGRFVFSVEHPITSAPQTFGPIEEPVGQLVWPVEGYLDEGPRTRNWFADGVVKYHRSIETYVASVLRAGLVLTDLVEWGPTDEQLTANPDWVVEGLRPPFLLVGADRG